MKKLFISCPMKGYTDVEILENMRRMYKIANSIFKEDLEVINSYIQLKPPANVNVSMWYLGKSIEKLAEADYFIGVTGPNIVHEHIGCSLEETIAHNYGIPIYLVDIKYINGIDNKYTKGK